MNATRFVLFVISVLASVLPVVSQQTADVSAKLQYVVILSRHGVRAPASAPERLNQYSFEPWPHWDVPPGYLTAHGRRLISLFGAYDRAYFGSLGLFHAKDCEDAARVTYWADNEQRTLETARGMAEGMLPGCEVKIGSQAKDEPDPLFKPLAAGVGVADGNLAKAAVLGRVGDNPKALMDLYQSEIDELAQLMHGDATKSAWLHEPSAIYSHGKSTA